MIERERDEKGERVRDGIDINKISSYLKSPKYYNIGR